MRRRCRQNIDRSGIRVRMRPLHVNHALVFRNFKLREMRVNQRRFALLDVYMKQRGIKSRQQQRHDGAACSHLSHGRILMKPHDEVNGWSLKSSLRICQERERRLIWRQVCETVRIHARSAVSISLNSRPLPEDCVGGTVEEMKTVISVNVGLPRELQIEDQSVLTGIFKTPVSGLVRVRALNLDGDRQADLTVHGGADKAVYLYPSEHYAFWQQVLDQQLGWGAFGENLTVAGLAEEAFSIGDHLGIGTAVLQVTQPRLPCFKLAAKLRRDDIIERFLGSRKTGFYARVLKEGALQAGDPISLLQEEPQHLTIHELTGLYLTKQPSRSQIDRALSVDALAASWREHFSRLLA